MSRPRELSELRSEVGQTLGKSDWVTVTQEMIDAFAETTGDKQWIHIDVDRAKSSPYGSTIAHGFLILSLGAPALKQVLNVSASRGVNYGLDRVRFIEPVRAGARVRASLLLSGVVEEADVWMNLKILVTFQLEGNDRPACTAEMIVRYYH